ncbi:MAG: helix-turn-helix transcriptional regulator [Bacteroidetes bacterium]|nr:helix-turn-helix transcriptional regulator [Bacteroidota bacterium]
MSVFGERLKLARKRAFLSVEELADKTNVAASVFYKYESGKVEPPQEKLKSICQNLGCTSDFLLGNEIADQNPKTGRMLKIYNSLSSENQDTIIILMNGLRMHSLTADVVNNK